MLRHLIIDKTTAVLKIFLYFTLSSQFDLYSAREWVFKFKKIIQRGQRKSVQSFLKLETRCTSYYISRNLKLTLMDGSEIRCSKLSPLRCSSSNRTPHIKSAPDSLGSIGITPRKLSHDCYELDPYLMF